MTQVVFFSSPKTQIMQKNYDVHRAVSRQSRRAELHYKGVIDFSGGAYGILKAAVEREREMEGGLEGMGAGAGEGAGAGAKEGTGKELQPEDSDTRRRLQDIEIKERELRELELELDLMERRQKLQSQVTMITSCSVLRVDFSI